jgi:hypothetical protein
MNVVKFILIRRGAGRVRKTLGESAYEPVSLPLEAHGLFGEESQTMFFDTPCASPD